MRVPLSGLWQEFKAFAFKGNMIELAVAVVIGAAFGGVVKAMVDDIVMPAVNYAVIGVKAAKDTATNVAEKASQTVGLASTKPGTQSNMEQASTAPAMNGPATPPAPAIAAAPAVAAPAAPAPPAPVKDDPTKAVNFTWTVGLFKIGDFLGALLNFILIAFAVFILIVKLLGSAMKRVAGSTPSASEPTSKECPFCLSVIPLKAKKCAQCTADLPMTA